MKKKLYFNSIAELQEIYPVGSVIHEETEETTVTRYFYNKKDFDYLKHYYSFVEPVDDVTCFCRKIQKHVKVVEGYIFDGEYWRPARNSWDGWLPYDEDDFR